MISFDPRNVIARKPHKCYTCNFVIPKGQVYVACPIKDDDDKFETIHLCIECAYLLRHKTGKNANAFSQGCLTERRIPNCLRKLRTEFRKDPIGAINSMSNIPQEPQAPKLCQQIVVKGSEFKRRIFHLPESRFKVEQFSKGASLTVKAGVAGESRNVRIMGAWSTDGSGFGCNKRQIAVLVE